jgi:hypothetical protein
VLDLSSNDLAADEGALEALFAALKACALEGLDISGVGLGPAGLTLFSAVLAPETPFSATINAITMSSTGDPYQPMTYTLDGLQGGADPNLDLSSKDFGPADLQVLSMVSPHSQSSPPPSTR